MKYRIRNKWIVVFGAILAQIAIGALYAWSLFNQPISKAFGWELTTVVTTYSIALASFSLTTIISGRIHLSKGARFTTLIGGLLYSSGVLLSSFAQTPIMLYLTYGVMGGIGVGFIYVCQLSTLVKWFPTHRGAVTGVATASFAVGGFVFKKVYYQLLDVAAYTPEVISNAFLTLGVIFAVMTIGGALLLDVPDDAPEVKKCKNTGAKDFSTREMLRSPNFYKLLVSDLLALMPGLLIIGLAKDIGMQLVNLDVVAASAIVGYIALVNAVGRLAAGRFADKFGALNVYRVMYLVTIISLAILSFAKLSYPVFFIAIMGIVVGYGSFLSVVPTIVGKLFGAKNFSANYGLIFQAYGIAALIGPVIKKNSAGFTQTFTIAMITAITGLIIASTIKDTKAVHDEVPAKETTKLELEKKAV